MKKKKIYCVRNFRANHNTRANLAVVFIPRSPRVHS